jgi:hypothetical protein
LGILSRIPFQTKPISK